MSDLLFGLFCLVGFFLLIDYVKRSVPQENVPKRDVPPCPPHKWVYRKQPESEDEYMICDKCERFPLQD